MTTKSTTLPFLPCKETATEKSSFCSFHIENALGSSDIHLSYDFDQFETHWPVATQYFLLVDALVWPLIEHESCFAGLKVYLFTSKEEHKTLQEVEKIYQFLLENEADRESCLICVGGGIVSDVGGYVAATYLRGISCVVCPSTVLACVDAAVGGKTGVNFRNVKNIIGAFKQPQLIWCNLSLLDTLPEQEFLSGLGEVVKHAAIGSAELFHFLEENSEAVLNRDKHALMRCVKDSIALKGGVVTLDPTEKKERRLLNFGHTVGHALEVELLLPHGFAIALGMVFAAKMSTIFGSFLKEEEKKLIELIDKLNLPTTIPSQLDIVKLLHKIKYDKKREDAGVYFIFLENLGKAYYEKISFEALEECLNDLCRTSEKKSR